MTTTTDKATIIRIMKERYGRMNVSSWLETYIWTNGDTLESVENAFDLDVRWADTDEDME